MLILAISGSLRARSLNGTQIDAAVLAAPGGMTLVRYQGLAQLPLVNPDLDHDPLPPAVAELRSLVGGCDGILICSPEYARGVAGAMKNALDWLVSSVECPGKPVAVVNASGRATVADAHLRLTLRTMDGRLIETASVTIALPGLDMDVAQLLADRNLRPQLDAMLAQLHPAIASPDAATL